MMGGGGERGTSGCGLGWLPIPTLQAFCVNQHHKWTKWVKEQYLCRLLLSYLFAAGTKSQSPGSFSPPNALRGASGKCGRCSETRSALQAEQVLQNLYELHIVWREKSPPRCIAL